MIPTLDTNILVYATDARNLRKQAAAQGLITSARASAGALALQVCGEFYSVATTKLKQPAWMATQIARNWMHSFPVFPATIRSTERALAEAAAGRLSFWDANLLAAAEEAGCTHLITEDMQDGFRLGRIEVVQAFVGDAVSDRASSLFGSGWSSSR